MIGVVYNKKQLDIYIDPDDHVSTVFRKIAYHLKTQPNNIYIWTYQPLNGDGHWQLQSFLDNVFKGESLIDMGTFLNACNNAFGLNLVDKKHMHMLTREMAMDILKKTEIKHIVQPIGHFFMDGEFVEYLPYEPTKNATQATSALYLSSNMATTIESIIGVVVKQTLHVTTKTDIKENHKLYFPFEKEQKDLKQFITYIEENEALFAKDVDTKKLNTTSYLNILYTKSKPLRNQHQVDLSVFFNDLHASDEVPFIKYKARTNVFHKVHKKFLASAADIRDFDRWYDVNSFKMQDNTYIVLKIKYNTKGYITLIINDKLQTDVRLNFQVKDEERISSIPNIISLVNRVIEGMKLPVNVIHDLLLDYDISRLVTFNIAALEIKANKNNAEAFVKTKMFHYFDVLPSEANNILKLQYKKVDNFGKSENVSMFIQYHFKEPKEEVIKKIIEFFSLSEEDALNEYEKWELQKETGDLLPTEQIRYERFVEVKIRFNSPIDVKYFISGATSIQQNDRIVRLVGHILEASTSKTRESKKDAEAKRLAEEEAKKIIPLSEEEEDDDDDWAAELKELESEFQEEKKDKKDEAKPAFVEEEKEFKLKGFVKRMLDNADRELFNYKSEGMKRHDYASMCGWVDRRQPVVINADEKKVIDEKYPGAYEGYVKSGSTTELARKHFYICPKVWCPRSRVAIPPALYKEKGKDACPGSEEPILFESKSFWGLGDKSFDRKHFPGFLAKHTRPDGLCLPCCFKIAPSEGNRNKQRQELCVSKTDENDEVVVDDVVGAEKYIKGDAYFPLETGRYGLLPKQLHDFLGKNNCGSRYNGTGLMNDKTDCYLRKGIFHGSQSFIQCMIHCMENPKVTSYRDLLDLFKVRLTITQFMLLENGKILQLFVDKSRSIFSSDFDEFKEWMIKDSEYVARFNLLKLQTELKKAKKFSRDILFYKDIIREFMIYYSYKNFMAFMNTPDIEKDHRILLDLFNISTEWLNINEYNFVVLDIDIEGKVHIDCSLNRETRQFVNKKTPFVFIVKYGRFYEPLCHVKTASNENISSTFKFAYQAKDHPRIKDILTFYYSNCSTTKQVKEANADIDIALFLESKGYKPKYYVIDYDFRLCGLILSNNIYVPFFEKKDVFSIKGLRFVYISDVVLFKCLEDRKALKKVFAVLQERYGEFFGIQYIVADGPHIHGLVLKKGTFVPVNVKSGSLAFKQYTEDLYLFINEQDADERVTFMKTIFEHKKNITELLTKFYAKLDEKTKMEIMFLRDPRNPLPLDYKRTKMTKLMESALVGIKDIDVMELTDLVLNRFAKARKTLVKKFNTSPEEVLFDFNDIQEGRLKELAERAQNPYKLFHKKLNELFEDYVFEGEVQDADEFHEFLNKDSQFAEVPAKYGAVQYRKLLKGFNVLQNDNDILYKLFAAASTVTKKTAISVDVLKSIVKTNIVRDFKSQTLEGMEVNPSYVNHLKKMKIKQPTLDAVLEIINSIHYRPSFYEIKVLARAIDVNIILIGRQNLKNPQGLFEVVYTRSSFYLFFVQSYDRFKVADNFELVVKDKKDILLSKKDIPVEIIKMVNDYVSTLKS